MARYSAACGTHEVDRGGIVLLLSGRHGHQLLALGGSLGAGILDLFFFLHRGFLHADALADDGLDILALFFQRLFLLDLGQCHDPLALVGFELLGLRHALSLDGVGPLLVALGHQNLAVAVLGSYLHLFVGLNLGALGLQALFLRHLLDLGRLAGADAGNFTPLFLLIFGQLLFELQDGFLRFHILLLDRFLLVALDLVGLNLLFGRQGDDLLDALGVEDIILVQGRKRRLFEVVDGAVVEHVAVEVGADYLQDFGLEAVAGVVELDEIEVLAHGLERFGKLGIE